MSEPEALTSPENNVTNAAAAIAIKDGKVLLVREGEGSSHITGKYGIPSGRLEPGESDLDAAVREFAEESGLSASREDFSEFPGNFFQASIPRKGGIVVNFNWRVFRVRNFSGKLKGSDDVTPEWVPIEDLEKMHNEDKLLPNILNAIDAAMKAN